MENEKFESPYQSPESQNIKLLHRGIWAEKLSDGQELPLGGSMFSNELSIKLELDFKNFEDQLNKFTKENIESEYAKSKDSVIEWLNKIGSNVDPYIYFVCWQTQQKVFNLLEADPKKPSDSWARKQAYSEGKVPKLSELKGKSECGERAALGQYLLQKAGVDTAYMSGITMADANDRKEYPEDHSFIVLKNPKNSEETLIFDIARPRHQYNLPRVLKTDAPFTHELLKDKEELLVRATEVLQGGKLWFGVGDPVAGQHESIEVVEKDKNEADLEEIAIEN